MTICRSYRSTHISVVLYCNSIPEMDSLSGQKLLRRCGSVTSADEALEGKKVVLFYFSARWSPPCAVFTPILNDFYQVVSEKLLTVTLVTVTQYKAIWLQ